MATLSGQVTFAGWYDTKPLVQVRDDAGREHAIEARGPIAWRVGDGATCTGRWDADGWQPCPDAAPVQRLSQCPACAPDLACVFEPACQDDPDSCHCPFGQGDHAVYIAYYGTLPKVGMTRFDRVAARLHEQGADAYMVAARLPNRARARATERRIAHLYRLPEWRRRREIVPQLARPVPWDRVAARADSLRQRIADRFPDCGELHRVEHARLPEPLRATPTVVAAAGTHRGVVVGAKGRYVIYEGGGGGLDAGVGAPLRALPLGHLIGRRLSVSDELP